MSARTQPDRVIVALAAVSCGRLSGAVTVRAGRGSCSASADRYRVTVTEPGIGPRIARKRQPMPEVVLEHWSGDAEMLELRSPIVGAVGRSAPRERARVAARTLDYYDLESLQIEYPDGARLSASGSVIVIDGPRRGTLHRRRRLLRASVAELL